MDKELLKYLDIGQLQSFKFSFERLLGDWKGEKDQEYAKIHAAIDNITREIRSRGK